MPGTFARFVTTEGDFTVRLFDQEAPQTVENFVGLAEGTKQWSDPRTNQKVQKPYYDGTIFHRVIDGFMIQGGDPLGQGIGGPGYRFDDEISPELTFQNPYIFAMANAGIQSGRGTNGSQFFITTVATPWLQGKHTIFGEVTEGKDVVDKIGKTRTAAQDRPAKDIVINSVKIQKG